MTNKTVVDIRLRPRPVLLLGGSVWIYAAVKSLLPTVELL